MMELGVEGNDALPRIPDDKAPDQSTSSGVLARGVCSAQFCRIAKRVGSFNQSKLFLEFLMGKRTYACTPWGMPTYNVFGWQKPCYLLQDGYVDTFQELLDTLSASYGTESGNPKCANCMVHRVTKPRPWTILSAGCVDYGDRKGRVVHQNTMIRTRWQC